MIEHEIYSETAKNLAIEVKNGEVYALDSSIEKGKAARVIKDERLGFAFSTKPETEEQELIDMALNVAESVEGDPALVFPNPEKAFDISPDFQGILNVTTEEKINFTKELEASALKFDKRIKTVRQPSYEETFKEIKITNSNGVDARFITALCAMRVTAVAEDKNGSERATEIEFALDPKKINPAILGKKASERAISYLNSKKISSCKCRCLFDRRVVGEIVSLLAPSFFADSVYKNRSRFKDKLGTKIYSSNITLINDPTLITGFSSAPYNAEGVANKRTPIVRGGILQNFLSDLRYSKKINRPSTASSVRPQISQMPKIGAQNIYIEAGKKNLSQLKREMSKGFFITDVMGLHMVNQITGDFSVGAEGFWIENSEELHGIKGVTIAGNLHDILNRVISVGSDLKFWQTTGGVSLLVEEIAVSGT